MAYTDLLKAKYVAAAFEAAPATSWRDYLGSALFGTRKQMSLDLSWVKGYNGIPVSLAPSAFDAEIPLRARNDAELSNTEMPLFREGIMLSEKDRRALMEAEALGDAYVSDVLSRVFDDEAELIRSAKVVPERMIWQLLAPTNGKPAINIAAKGVTYAYDYDPSGAWFTNNFIDGSANSWATASSATPITDLMNAVQAAKAKGVILTMAVMSTATFNMLRQSEEVKTAITTTTGIVTNQMILDGIKQHTGVDIVEYSEVFKAEDGTTHSFIPDGVVTLLPEGALGTMTYAVTNEEYDLTRDPSVDVAVFDNVAITTTIEGPPVRITTYATEIVLPTFERMNEVYAMKVTA